MVNVAAVSSVVDSCTLIFVEVDKNSNKVWKGKVLSDGYFVAEWGRVGTKLQSKTNKFTSVDLALNKFAATKKQKIRKGYTEAQILNPSSNPKTNTTSPKQKDLNIIATKQIEHGKDSKAKELIRYLVQVNIHEITSQTDIVYDSETGSFTTPLGLVTHNAIAEARQYLLEIANAEDKHCRSTRKAINNYLRLIPQKLSHKIDYTNFCFTQELKRQLAILDALSAAIDGKSSNINTNLFECSINRIAGGILGQNSIFKEINDLYRATINQKHNSARYNLKRLYEVNIPSMRKDFDSKAKDIGNIKQHWHGTRASNLLSILKQGLIIPPTNAVQCTGRMFGNGIYGSQQSTKALNYATNFWNKSGGKNQRVFMLLCDFAMGKEYHPQHHRINFPVRGYDSTYVKPGTANVMNQESIVYSTAQVNIRYLCEFS